MCDSAERVERVLALVLPALQACPDLVVSGATWLTHRGGGGRAVLDVSPVAGRVVGGSAGAVDLVARGARADLLPPVQVRLMDDSVERVERVLALVLPALRACPDLVVHDSAWLTHRGGGGRVVFTVSLAAGSAVGDSAVGGPGRVWVRAERADGGARAARSGRVAGGGRRALPPGGAR
ncbi:hypothetical protein ACFVVA_36885 [Kitasatospora sp. NPDC058048]|uniref:hypothetical protein n=1 Tax=Kitasatospora sp. NPDC058048 TaxID=3346313 RepID=UPI0036D93F1C